MPQRSGELPEVKTSTGELNPDLSLLETIMCAHILGNGPYPQIQGAGAN